MFSFKHGRNAFPNFSQPLRDVGEIAVANVKKV